MKAQLTQENLNKALTFCSRVVSSPKSLPILNNILLKTEGGKLKISATNLELGMNLQIRAKVEEEGSITIPAKILTDFISNNQDKNIELTVKDLKLNIVSDNFKATISGLHPDEFPTIPEIDDGKSFKTPAKELSLAIPRVSIASTADDARPVLSGVYFSLAEDQLKLVSTDSYRLAEHKIKLKNKYEAINIIVPSRATQELVKAIIVYIDNKEAEIEITASDSQILFKVTDDLEISSRLIEGNFPNYEQIIPSTSTTKVQLSARALISAIKSVSLFSQNASNRVELSVNEDQTTVSAKSSQIGESQGVLSSELEGSELTAAFNARFLLDALNNFNQDEVRMEFTESLAPVKIVSDKDTNYVHVIMPLKTDD